MTSRAFNFMSSLRLTVVCLGLGVVLVFLGTLAQVNEGLYQAQHRWFRSFLIWWGPEGANWRIPVFPGGYLLGTVLLLNLVAAHIKRFQFSWKKLGIHITHAGIVLLLLGQLITDMLSRETQMSFAEGETKNYSEDPRGTELVFVRDVEGGEEEVVSIPEGLLRKEKEIRHPSLPVTVRLKEFHINADVRARGPMVDKGPPPADHGVGPRAVLEPLPETKKMDDRNVPAAVVELTGKDGPVGSWLVSPKLRGFQEVEAGGEEWRVALRWERVYTPFSMTLLKATHEVYRGTEIPKNFQSRVRIDNRVTRENREVDIYMNNPLRYAGLTFFQYQMGRDELDMNRGTSTFQVVKNPAWLTPYVGCILVGGGLMIQFLMHLVAFIKKPRKS